MTGIDERNGSPAKAASRDMKDQDTEQKARVVQKPDESGTPSHYVANQGAPGGTSDDDGDSENQQDPARRAPRDSDRK